MCTPELVQVVNGQQDTEFTAHFNSISDLLHSSALARAMVPVEVRPITLKL